MAATPPLKQAPRAQPARRQDRVPTRTCCSLPSPLIAGGPARRTRPPPLRQRPGLCSLLEAGAARENKQRSRSGAPPRGGGRAAAGAGGAVVCARPAGSPRSSRRPALAEGLPPASTRLDPHGSISLNSPKAKSLLSSWAGRSPSNSKFPPRLMAASRLVGGAGRDTGSGQGQGRVCLVCLILLAKCVASAVRMLTNLRITVSHELRQVRAKPWGPWGGPRSRSRRTWGRRARWRSHRSPVFWAPAPARPRRYAVRAASRLRALSRPRCLPCACAQPAPE